MKPKSELLQYYQWLRRYGYNDSHSGNASIRDGERIWVTPTGACADTLTENQLIAVPLQGEIPQGASLDAPLHRMVYQRNPEATAVLHSHGAYSVALTMNGEDFHPIDFEGQYYFPRIPVISIPYDRYLEQAADKVSAVLADNRVTVVRGHGVYAVGTSMNLAYKWTCSFELSAKTRFIAQQAGTHTA